MWSRLFGKRQLPPEPVPDEDLVIVPMPPLISVLLAKRLEKGAELTEAEVLAIRDNAVCMTMRRGHAEALAQKRGFPDVDPEHVWGSWQVFLLGYLDDDEGGEAA
jgi:hypothetical protein